ERKRRGAAGRAARPAGGAGRADGCRQVHGGPPPRAPAAAAVRGQRRGDRGRGRPLRGRGVPALRRGRVPRRRAAAGRAADRRRSAGDRHRRRRLRQRTNPAAAQRQGDHRVARRAGRSAGRAHRAAAGNPAHAGRRRARGDPPAADRRARAQICRSAHPHPQQRRQPRPGGRGDRRRAPGASRKPM
ncbi:MAG: Shikimate kinase I, partial [uncultured Sphingomonas sp.]